MPTKKERGKEKRGIKKPKTITNQDAERIRKQLNEQDCLIFDVAVETGLRISDILNFRAKYINKVMYIKEQKTKKHKAIELTEGLYKRLEPLADHNDYHASKYAFKSPYKRNKHIHRSSYHRRLKNACRALKIDFSAHSTRKLYARNIFERTKDIFQVQEALNHKYVTTTASYLDIDLSELISAALK